MNLIAPYTRRSETEARFGTVGMNITNYSCSSKPYDCGVLQRHGITLRVDTYAMQPCAMASHDCDAESTVTLTRVMIMTTCIPTIVEFRCKYVVESRCLPSECEYLSDRYPVTATPHAVAATPRKILPYSSRWELETRTV